MGLDVNLYRPQESEVYFHTTRIEHETEALLELMTNYDVDLQYHPRKINVVPDALSRKPEAYMNMQLTQQKEILKEMMWLDLMVVRRTSASGQLMAFQIQPTLMEKIRAAQSKDLRLQKFSEQVKAGLRTDVHIHMDGALYTATKFVYLKGRFDKKS